MGDRPRSRFEDLDHPQAGLASVCEQAPFLAAALTHRGRTMRARSTTRRLAIKRYWAPPAHAASQAAPLEELVDEAEELLLASVKSRLVAGRACRGVSQRRRRLDASRRACCARCELAEARARRSAAVLTSSLPRRARRLEHVFAAEPFGDRHVDWVAEGRRHMRARLYGPRLREQASRSPETSTSVRRRRKWRGGSRRSSAR